ncbi:MAG: ADP-ribosylglycohydrolase family protein [Anaerolineaceae bacterium]|nr:ADP-ribosylglycohydrolase family protein [Anaerolineaceae bacterium]
MSSPHNYAERVYAGVLGKAIGVFLGHPFELWTYQQVMEELGEITGYVSHRFDSPVVVTDDDLAGTFTFLRALPDYGCCLDLTPAQIGQTWLNYLVEGRTLIWWGGLGNSTEHTAYLNLKRGIPAPRSGSIAQNGRIVAEQLGSQIFIDGFAMVAGGDPALAADLARRAASVSHDGEAIYAAQVMAAMEAQAFVEPDLTRCVDTALDFIPCDSDIYRLIQNLREWHAVEPDWRVTREKLEAGYGYDSYPGVCHVVPNHGLIHLSLLYGGDDFQEAMKIVNTSGWDTDCNAGNVGCFLGIKNGLAAFDGPVDWRGPIADRFYMPSADGGRAITDAVRESIEVINLRRRLDGEPLLQPKQGARFHFEFPGAVQGFETTDETLHVENVFGNSGLGKRSLALRYDLRQPGVPLRAATPTFIPEEFKTATQLTSEELTASPTLYPGQRIRASLKADAGNVGAVGVSLFISFYGKDDVVQQAVGELHWVSPGVTAEVAWTVPDLHGRPVVAVGMQVECDQVQQGSVYLDWLTWDGAPRAWLGDPGDGGSMWRRAWVNACSAAERDQHPDPKQRHATFLVQNEGRGLYLQGTQEWTNYAVHAGINVTTARAHGVAVCVQGLRRYYALLRDREGQARLVKMFDGQETVLAQGDFAWKTGANVAFRLETCGGKLEAALNGQVLFEVEDGERPFTHGSVAYVIEEGCLRSQAMRIEPIVCGE